MSENLNLPPFVKGDLVICIKSNKGNEVEEGKKYTVISVKKATCCGVWVVNVGAHRYYVDIKCSSCGHVCSHDSHYMASRFRKVQESKFRAVSFEKVMEETEIICEN